jgi:hypothetical protein
MDAAHRENPDLLTRIAEAVESRSPQNDASTHVWVLAGALCLSLAVMFVLPDPAKDASPQLMLLARTAEGLVVALLAGTFGYYVGVRAVIERRGAANKPVHDLLDLYREAEQAKFEAAKAEFEAAKVRDTYMRLLAALDSTATPPAARPG